MVISPVVVQSFIPIAPQGLHCGHSYYSYPARFQHSREFANCQPIVSDMFK